MSRAKLSADDIRASLVEIPGWSLNVHSFPVSEGRPDIDRISKEYRFKNFAQALEFTNRVGVISERFDHHPDIELTWGRVRVHWWTHDHGGVSPLDMDLARRTDAEYG